MRWNSVGGLAASTALVVLVAAAPARAEARADAAAAQALFDEGLKLLDAGQIDAACPKLDASDRLDPNIATKFQLARCHEAAGKAASAWALYLEVAAEAKKSRNTLGESAARDSAKRLEAKLAKLVVEIAPETLALPGLSIKRDNTDMGVGAVGTALPIDPGMHEIVVTATRKKPFKVTVTITPGEPVVRVAVRALEDDTSDEAPNPALAGPAKLSVLAEPGDAIAIDGTLVAVQAWRGVLPPGSHDVKVTGAGKRPYHASIELVATSNRTLDVHLEQERPQILPTWAWVTGSVLLTGGALVGGYFLFRPESGRAPSGTLGTAVLPLVKGASF